MKDLAFYLGQYCADELTTMTRLKSIRSALSRNLSSCHTFGLDSSSQLVKSITGRQSNERRNHPYFRIARSEARCHHQHSICTANGTASHFGWPPASSVNRILVARAADHLRANAYDVTYDVDNRVVNGCLGRRGLQLRRRAMGWPANFDAGKFASVILFCLAVRG